MTVYKIKSEDKAAFLNRLEKLKININSNDLKNKNKLQDGNVISWFELTVTDPEHEQQINNIINQSPAINQISEMENNKKKMTKDQLKEMVRQELQAVLAEKKKVKDEEKLDEAVLEESPAAEILSVLAGVAGLGLGSAAIMKAQDILKAKKPELFKKLQGISGAIEKADPSKRI
jgi:1-deoxy-D-xylulose 5-phosphate reductoisomerase